MDRGTWSSPCPGNVPRPAVTARRGARTGLRGLSLHHTCVFGHFNTVPLSARLGALGRAFSLPDASPSAPALFPSAWCGCAHFVARSRPVRFRRAGSRGPRGAAPGMPFAWHRYVGFIYDFRVPGLRLGLLFCCCFPTRLCCASFPPLTGGLASRPPKVLTTGWRPSLLHPTDSRPSIKKYSASTRVSCPPL